MKPKNRIQEISLEIKTLLKTDPTSKKLESLQRELKELLIKKRLPPTIYKAVNQKERKPRQEKKKISTLIKSNLIDFQKAKSEKSAEEFSNEIENESLYEELKPKKVSKN